MLRRDFDLFSLSLSESCDVALDIADYWGTNELSNALPELDKPEAVVV
jgi:hypothetical protein